MGQQARILLCDVAAAEDPRHDDAEQENRPSSPKAIAAGRFPDPEAGGDVAAEHRGRVDGGHAQRPPARFTRGSTQP